MPSHVYHWETYQATGSVPGRMTQFLGTHLNRLDAKGRVSIPASFRAVLRPDADGGPSLVLRPSHTHRCIEGWPAAAFRALAAPLDDLDVFSQEHDDMAATIYADACPTDPDREGRIVLPANLVQHAGLSESVSFMGAGRIFQIWEPQAGERFREESRSRTNARRLTLRGSRNNSDMPPDRPPVDRPGETTAP